MLWFGQKRHRYLSDPPSWVWPFIPISAMAVRQLNRHAIEYGVFPKLFDKKGGFSFPALIMQVQSPFDIIFSCESVAASTADDPVDARQIQF